MCALGEVGASVPSCTVDAPLESRLWGKCRQLLLRGREGRRGVDSGTVSCFTRTRVGCCCSRRAANLQADLQGLAAFPAADVTQPPLRETLCAGGAERLPPRAAQCQGGRGSLLTAPLGVACPDRWGQAGARERAWSSPCGATDGAGEWGGALQSSPLCPACPLCQGLLWLRGWCPCRSACCMGVWSCMAGSGRLGYACYT